MEVIEDLDRLTGQFPGVAAGIGTFDGVHRGHQEILRRVLSVARARGGTAAVFTFTGHPLAVLNPARAPRLITPYPLKRHLLGASGIELLVAVPFTRALADTSAEDFVKTILVDRLRAQVVCIGHDFGFGRDRRGTPVLLESLGREYGFGVEVVPPVCIGGVPVRSTRIRELLAGGAVREAARFLGRLYRVLGRVERGRGRGRALGFPTANLRPPDHLLVPDGVYACRAEIAGGVHDAVANVGQAPTFGGGDRWVEVHLLPWDGGELYGQEMALGFVERLRGEERFASAADLRTQIARDREAARMALAEGSEGSGP